jgi:hypothetical protein
MSLDNSVRICSHCRGFRNIVVSFARSDGVPKAEREISRRVRESASIAATGF